MNRPLLFLPLSLLVFGLRQYENMLWGFQSSARGACGLAGWALYLFDYSPSEGAAFPIQALSSPAAGAEYFLNLLGSSLFWQQEPPSWPGC